MKPRSEEMIQATDRAVRVLLAAALLSIALAPSAKAGPVTTYSYTGSAFTTFNGTDACGPECYLYGSFTMSSPLPTLLTLSAVTPTSFSFTDGNPANTLTNLNTAGGSDEASFLISTNGSGQITAWNIVLDNPALGMLQTDNQPPTTAFDEGWDAPLYANNASVEYANLPPQFVPSTPSGSTPEPASLVLLGAGLVGLGIMRRRRK